MQSLTAGIRCISFVARGYVGLASKPLVSYRFKGRRLVRSSACSYANKFVDIEETISKIDSVSDFGSGNKLMRAYRFYLKNIGEPAIPTYFVVPSTEDWPRDIHGFKLGYNLASLRCRAKAFSAGEITTRIVTEAGGLQSYREYIWERKCIPALKTYVCLKRDLGLAPKEKPGLSVRKKNPLFSKKFVIPAESPWPKETHGLHLGKLLQNIEHMARGDLLDKRPSRAKQLEDLGLLSSSFNNAFETMLLPALASWVKMNVTGFPFEKNFIVPDDEAWPVLTRGSNLRDFLTEALRRHDSKSLEPRLHSQLETLGYSYKHNVLAPTYAFPLGSQFSAEKRRRPLIKLATSGKERDVLRYVKALQQLGTLCKTHNIDKQQLPVLSEQAPYKFCEENFKIYVPLKDTKRGNGEVNVGKLLRDVQRQSSLLKKEPHIGKMIQQLGFATKEEIFEIRVNSALKIWQERNSDSVSKLPPYTFIVPAQDPWPMSAWGRYLRRELAQYNTEK
eukprot:m.118133 g.118133  ORF g.118133 m.118133 type:complete len:504 (+) comp14273_c1_seq4:187-1698(+)